MPVTKGIFIKSLVTKGICRAFVQKYNWTPNFNGVNSYGQLLSAWQPTGDDWDIEVNLYVSDNYTTQTIYGAIAPEFRMYVLRGYLAARGLDGSINIVQAGTNELATVTISSSDNLNIEFSTPNYIGSYLGASQFFNGQIHSIKLTDNLDSSNSIEIDTVIRSATMPTDTYLYNKLDTTVYPELVTNGDFSDGLTGWNATNAILTTVNEELHASLTVGYGRTKQLVPVVVGNTYRFTGSPTSELGVVSLRNRYDTSYLYAGVPGAYTDFTFIATESFVTVWCIISSGTVGDSATFDNISVKQTNIVGQLYNLGTESPYVIKAIESPVEAWTPLSLFLAGEQGAYFDPSDLTTLFQDSTGLIPVTADGDPVGLMLDKSGNDNHAYQTISASRPTYRTDGILHWLEFDGVDDYMVFPEISVKSMCCSIMSLGGTVNVLLGQQNVTGNHLFTRDVTYAVSVNGSVGNSGGIAINGGDVYPDGLTGTDISYPAYPVYPLNEASVLSVFHKANALYSTLAKLGSNSLYYGNSAIYSMIISDSDVRESKSDIESYLATKSGVTL